MEYWTVSHGNAIRTGWSCRQCHQVIYRGEPIVCRDGRKMRFMYHQQCYSGYSDPRTQSGSSFNAGRWIQGQQISNIAPAVKGRGKWSVQHYGYLPGPMNLPAVDTQHDTHPQHHGDDVDVIIEEGGQDGKDSSREQPQRQHSTTNQHPASTGRAAAVEQTAEITWGFARKEKH